MTNYVLGFAFDRKREKVALIKKTKPEWQNGFLNGIGGKIENGEDPKSAMIREFEEEAGMLILDWSLYAIMHGDNWECHVFLSLDNDLNQIESRTEEQVWIYDVNFPNSLQPPKIIKNLNWLIPAALNNEGEILKIFY